VVYVSSQSGIRGFADETAYCAAKHGLEGFMKALALEAEGTGVAVSTITPGMLMRTPMSERNYDAEAKAKWVDPALLAPAFTHLGALADARHNGERLDAWKLAQEVAHAG
jgi:NAD(P)-dependent dehydrogenase (short-subunit alcohol dehydrogenase family)